MSSGAAYGDVYTDGPVTKKTQAVLPQKDNPEYCYIISKINTEAKHRTLSKLNIIDLRVYAFFSSMVDVSTPFLMSEIVSSILHKKVFETSSQEMVRDYSSGATLYALIMAIMKRPCNGAFDVYSTKPVSKKDLLVALSKKFGLEYREHTVKSTTKQKPSKKYYYSLNKNLDAAFGYKPTMSSLEIITHELQKRLTWF
jgi:hypothetical protein